MNILAFKDNILKHFKKILLGGDDLTHMICDHLKLNFDLSEQIKSSYADVSKTDHHQDEEVLVKKDSAYLPIRRHDIDSALEPYIQKMIHEIQKVLESAGLRKEINRGIVLIGGGSLLTGLLDRLEQETQMAVSLGVWSQAIKSTQKYSAGLFASCVGLAYGGYLKSLASTIRPLESKNLIESVNFYIKDFYQEYF